MYRWELPEFKEITWKADGSEPLVFWSKQGNDRVPLNIKSMYLNVEDALRLRDYLIRSLEPIAELDPNLE